MYVLRRAMDYPVTARIRLVHLHGSLTFWRIERDLLRREPQVALRRVAGRPHEPVRRVDALLLGPQPSHVVTEPADRPPVHPTRSASTVAGMSGVSARSARTRASNGVNDVGADLRSYRGGDSEATALITVVREIPERSAIRAFGSPSAASLLISAQSSKVITLQSLSVHFSNAATVQFSSAVDTDAVREGIEREAETKRNAIAAVFGGTSTPKVRGKQPDAQNAAPGDERSALLRGRFNRSLT